MNNHANHSQMDPSAHATVVDPAVHTAAVEPAVHAAAAEPVVHNAAAEPVVHNAAAEPAVHAATVNPAAHAAAMNPGFAAVQAIVMDPTLAARVKLIEDVIVLAVSSANTLPSPQSGDVIRNSMQRVQAGEEVSFAAVSEFFAPAMKALADSSVDNTGVEETVMTRKDGILVVAVVEGDTLYTRVPAGTPIVKDQGESYQDSLEWLQNEGLVESVGKSSKSGLRLTAAVQFVTPASAMSMITGSAKAWTTEDERKFDPDKFQVNTKRNFVTSGVKVMRRA